MPQNIRASRQRAFACRSLLVAVAAASLGCPLSAILYAQSSPVRGYITAVHPPDAFDVDGQHVTMAADTQFGPVGDKAPVSNGPTRDAVQIGAWVEVYGPRDRKTKTIIASSVLIRDDWSRKLSGLAVIEKVISTVPDLVVAADGYHIRVTPATEVKLPHGVKSVAAVRPGMWVLYEGWMGGDGLVAANKVHFLSTESAKSKSQTDPGKSGPGAAAMPPEIEIDDQRTEIDLHDITWHFSKDQALQSRVRRIGMNLVPAYQRRLPENDPSKIHFEFIAVKNDTRDIESSTEGIILVPAQLAARFKNDDQLAAVLADAIAYSLQQGAPPVLVMNKAFLEESAGEGETYSILLSGLAVGSIYNHEVEKALQDQRERVALQLMADAGNDPWQAPEAWRLATPRNLPADTTKLKYPDRSGYQFAILNRMYRKPASTNATASGGTSNTSESTKP